MRFTQNKIYFLNIKACLPTSLKQNTSFAQDCVQTRLVGDVRLLPYPERLRSLGLPSLYYRRRRGDMIVTFKILHGMVDLDPDTFFIPAMMTTTRGHPWKLDKPRASSRIRRNAFGVRVINDWNALPLEVVSAETLNQFKARLDKHWIHHHYTIHDQD